MTLLYLNGKKISRGKLKALLGSLQTEKFISDAKNEFLENLNLRQTIEIPDVGYLVIVFDLQLERLSA